MLILMGIWPPRISLSSFLRWRSRLLTTDVQPSKSSVKYFISMRCWPIGVRLRFGKHSTMAVFKWIRVFPKVNQMILREDLLAERIQSLMVKLFISTIPRLTFTLWELFSGKLRLVNNLLSRKPSSLFTIFWPTKKWDQRFLLKLTRAWPFSSEDVGKTTQRKDLHLPRSSTALNLQNLAKIEWT